MVSLRFGSFLFPVAPCVCYYMCTRRRRHSEETQLMHSRLSEKKRYTRCVPECRMTAFLKPCGLSVFLLLRPTRLALRVHHTALSKRAATPERGKKAFARCIPHSERDGTSVVWRLWRVQRNSVRTVILTGSLYSEWALGEKKLV